jgi:peptidoglycan hydrolase-like protein with peptidoglycan-binding domain
LIGLTLVAVLVVGAGVGVYAARGTAPGAAASPTSSAPPAALTVASQSPAAGAGGVATDATVSVTFSTPVKPGSPTPTLTPPVAGSWQLVTPTTFEFVPAGPLVPSSTETVTVPGGPGGVVSVGGVRLAQTTTAQFTVAGGSTLRLQQLLAQLGYLPLSFTPANALGSAEEAAQPQEGAFAWRWAMPASLESLWTPGSPDVITQGAVMAFESQHGLDTDGQAGPAVWTALLHDVQFGTTDPNPYDYVSVSQALPESATVYSNGAVAYSTAVNTGVPAAATGVGTFPVYLRYTVTTMSGTNPDGSKYSDPGIKWVSYFHGGDALHAFDRPGYGYPQSVGCVEMPEASAAAVYPLTPIGTLVTVLG